MKRHIPNSITCCNLLSGCVATVFALRGVYDVAIMAIIAGAVFDFFDGMSARLLGVSSPIGKELDSLADDVTFGLAPAAMLYSMLCEVAPNACLPYAAFLMAAFSALRLAKFNLDARQTASFIGLPTPANALFWASLIVSWHERIAEWPYATWMLLAGMLISCYLLVAELPLFALKFKSLKWRANWVRYVFLLLCLPCFLLGWGAFAAIIVWYVVWAVVNRSRV